MGVGVGGVGDSERLSRSAPAAADCKLQTTTGTGLSTLAHSFARLLVAKRGTQKLQDARRAPVCPLATWSAGSARRREPS